MSLDEALRQYDWLLRNNQHVINDTEFRAYLSRERILIANRYEFDVNQFNTVYDDWKERSLRRLRETFLKY